MVQTIAKQEWAVGYDDKIGIIYTKQKIIQAKKGKFKLFFGIFIGMSTDSSDCIDSSDMLSWSESGKYEKLCILPD